MAETFTSATDGPDDDAPFRSRLTFEPWLQERPVWSPDSSRVAYSSNMEGMANLYWKPASGVGDAQLLLKSDAWKNATDWSPDGRHLIYNVNGSTKTDIWALPLSGGGKPFPLVSTPFDEPLGIRRAPYDFGYVYNDSFVAILNPPVNLRSSISSEVPSLMIPLRISALDK